MTMVDSTEYPLWDAEYTVFYPAHINFHVGSTRRFPIVSTYEEAEAVLLEDGYTLLREVYVGYLWYKGTLGEKDTQYVFVIFDDGQGYSTLPDGRFPVKYHPVPLYIWIYDLETLLAFAWHYHIPLWPQTLEEQRIFTQHGFEFYATHLAALQGWGEDEQSHAVGALYDALEFAQSFGRLRWH